MRTPEIRLHGQGNSLLPGLTLEAIASNVRPAEKRAKTINQLMMMMMMIIIIIIIIIITMRLVRAFEENAIHQGHQSLVKEAREFAEELGFTLDLSFPHPKCRDNTDGSDVPRDKIKRHLKKAAIEQRKTEVKEKKWQGRLLAARWEEDQLNQRGCFAWLKNWDTAPTHTIAGMLELYEQLTPTKVYYARKTQTNHPNDTLCRLCERPKVSLTCWRVVLRLRRISISRVIMRPSKYCFGKC